MHGQDNRKPSKQHAIGQGTQYIRGVVDKILSTTGATCFLNAGWQLALLYK